MYEELIDGIFEEEEDEELFQNAVNDGDFFLPIGVVSNPANKHSFFNRYTIKIDDDFEKNIETIHEHDGRIGIYVGKEFENPSLFCAQLSEGDRVTLHHEIENIFDMMDFFIKNQIQVSVYVPEDSPEYDVWKTNKDVIVVDSPKAHLPDIDVPLDDNKTAPFGIIDVSAFFDSDSQTLDEDRLRDVVRCSVVFLADLVNNATFPIDDIENAMIDETQLILSIAGVNELNNLTKKNQVFMSIIKKIVHIIDEEGEKQANFVRNEYEQNIVLTTAVPSRYNILPEIKENITMGIDVDIDSKMTKRKIHDVVKRVFNGTVLMFYDGFYLSSSPELKKTTTERRQTLQKLVKDEVDKTSNDDETPSSIESEDDVEDKGLEQVNDTVEEIEEHDEAENPSEEDSEVEDESTIIDKIQPVIKIMKYDLGCGFISLSEDTTLDMKKYDFNVDYHERETPCPVMKNITGIMLTANIHKIPLIEAVGKLKCDCDNKYQCINIMTSIINNGEL